LGCSTVALLLKVATSVLPELDDSLTFFVNLLSIEGLTFYGSSSIFTLIICYGEDKSSEPSITELVVATSSLRADLPKS